jgi:hypothetical protein
LGQSAAKPHLRKVQRLQGNNKISSKEKIMKASEIKKVLFGVLLSDGSLDTKTQRFGIYSKQPEYIDFLYKVFSGLTHSEFVTKQTYDKRFGVFGYRIWSKRSKYFSKMFDIFYPNGRKQLTPYVVDRLDALALAHVWMCDGYLEHAKNRKANTIQNVGWFCLESFPREELQLLTNRLKKVYGINSSLVVKPWGFGYRIRMGGESLQKFISLIYPHIIPCFYYKTELFYKRKVTALQLPSAEQYVKLYEHTDDIVRYSGKPEKT